MPLLHYYSSECAVMNYLCSNGPIQELFLQICRSIKNTNGLRRKTNFGFCEGENFHESYLNIIL